MNLIELISLGDEARSIANLVLDKKQIYRDRDIATQDIADYIETFYKGALRHASD